MLNMGGDMTVNLRVGGNNVVRRIAQVIGVLTMGAGAGQLLFPMSALNGLGLNSDTSSIFAFRLASLMIVCFGALLFHEVTQSGVKRRVVLWTGVQKMGAAALLLTLLLSHEINPIAWGVVAWDGLCGIILLLLPGYRART